MRKMGVNGTKLGGLFSSIVPAGVPFFYQSKEHMGHKHITYQPPTSRPSHGSQPTSAPQDTISPVPTTHPSNLEGEDSQVRNPNLIQFPAATTTPTQEKHSAIKLSICDVVASLPLSQSHATLFSPIMHVSSQQVCQQMVGPLAPLSASYWIATRPLDQYIVSACMLRV